MQADKSQFNSFTTTNGNLIWAGALTLAWKQLIKSFTKQAIKINSDNSQAQKIVQNFNLSKFSQQQIDNDSIYVKSGYGQKTVDLINSECRQKFPQKTIQDLTVVLQEQDIIAYAYLLKKLQFSVKFQRSSEKNFLFKDSKVQSFSASQKNQLQQIFCHYFENENKFMLSISGKGSKDQILFIKDSSVKSIQEALTKVSQKELYPMHLTSTDSFQMPVIELDLKHDVVELQGKQIDNQGLKGYAFGSVFQNIKLNIDQSGVTLENQGAIMMLMSYRQPRKFILNSDFWIVMKEQDKHPYFCALIQNPIDKNA